MILILSIVIFWIVIVYIHIVQISQIAYLVSVLDEKLEIILIEPTVPFDSNQSLNFVFTIIYAVMFINVSIIYHLNINSCNSINLICFIHQGLLDFFWAPSCHHVEFEFENVQESQEKYVIGENIFWSFYGILRIKYMLRWVLEIIWVKTSSLKIVQMSLSLQTLS